MGIKYELFGPDDWVYPMRRNFKMMCCDCGLTHSVDFNYKKGKITFRAARDERATGQARRRIRREKNGGKDD
jgi:hypothetical protein